MGPERYSGVGLAHRLEYVKDLAGVRYAYGIGERDVIYAGLDDPRNDAEHLAASGPALEWVAEDGRDVGPHVDAIFPAAGGDGGEAGEGLVHRRVQVLSAVTLGRRAYEHDLPDARRASSLVAPLVRDQAAIVTPSAGGSPASTSSASASCGIALGETNEVASNRLSPAAARASIRAIFSGVGRFVFSLWSPSRDPTSTISTDAGKSTRSPLPPKAARSPLWRGRGDRRIPLRCGLRAGRRTTRPGRVSRRASGPALASSPSRYLLSRSRGACRGRGTARPPRCLLRSRSARPGPPLPRGSA